MGSSSSSLLTHEELDKATENTQLMMSKILEFMMKELTVRDFIALSNPNECRKYVLFMANKLHKSFYELQIYPSKDRKGVLAFRRVSDFIDPKKEVDKERQGLCLHLAYYYTRIFQIYGALALTLIDDISLTRKSGVKQLFDENGSRLYLPGTRPYYAEGGDASGSVNLGNFEFLRQYLLMNEQKNVNEYKTVYNKAAIFFKKEPVEKDIHGHIIQPQQYVENKIHLGKFSIGISGVSTYSFVNMEAKNISSSADIKCAIKTLTYYPKQSTVARIVQIPTTILSSSTFDVHLDNGVYYNKGMNKTVNDFFDEFFDKLVVYIKQLIGTGTTNSSTTNSYKDLFTTQTKSEYYKDTPLYIEKTFQNLVKDKPLGHCIARALQLLKTAPLNDQEITSYICKAKFLETSRITSQGTKDVYSRSGITLPNEPLSTSPGLSALAQLFYDTIEYGTPKLIINERPDSAGGTSSLDEYKEFLKKMARYAGDLKNKDGQSRELSVEQGLKGIINRRDATLCRDAKKNPDTDEIKVNSSTAKSVYNIVSAMFEKQLNHAQKCGQIFKLLFDAKKDESTRSYRIVLSKNIIEGGIPEVNRINRMTRELLVEYYTSCEQHYIIGMGMILESIKQQPVAPSAPVAPVVPVAPSAPPLAPVAPSAPMAPLAPPLPKTQKVPPPKKVKKVVITKGGYNTMTRKKSRL